MVVVNMINEKSIIGNYCIISELAMGAFGRVYLAQHTVLTNRVVALKLMHTVPLSSEQECNQFLQEARFLELLRHDYILPILDVGIHQGMPYIVSEYASGGSLRDRMKHKTLQLLSEDEIQKILSQVGEALQYAHLKNIIHRDLKPENILFNARNDALLADFGLATMLASASIKYISNAGTPRYMSPEQFRGIVSKESDQYALGCIAYELWTGHPLFSGHDPFSLMYQHVNDDPIPPTKLNPDISPNVEQAILKALAKERHDRHADLKAFIAALCLPTAIQRVQKPTSGLTIANSNIVPELTSSVTDLVKQNQAVEDEEQSTFVKSASVDEESTFIKTALFGEESTFIKGVSINGVSTNSHNTGQNTPLPATPGHITSKELPALLPLTPLPELPTSRKHKRDRLWLIVALVSFIIIASLIGGSLTIYSSFHTSVSDKGKTIPTSGQLEVQPDSLDFGSLQVGVQVIQTVLITNKGAQPLDWAVDTGGITWLKVATNSGVIEPGGAQQIIDTTADTDHLAPGNYVASENVHSNGSITQVPVKLIVIASSGKKQAKISINPGILNFGDLNVDQQTSSLITVGNIGTLGLNWTADTGNVSWLSVSPGSGTIQSGGLPQTLSVRLHTANLSAGNYSATLNIQSNGGNSPVSVILGVSAPSPTQQPVTQPPVTQQPVTQPPGPTLVSPQINVNPQNLSFNNVPINTTRSQQLTITNSGGQSLNWSTNTNVSWISLDKNGGTVNAGSSQSINLTVNTNGLSGGPTYTGTVSFTSNGGAFNLSVSLNTVLIPAVLSISPNNLNAFNNCSYTAGIGWSCNVTLSTNADATSNLSWQASAGPGIVFSPLNGTLTPGIPANLNISFPSSITCPITYNLYIGQNTNNATAYWHCPSPTLTTNTPSLQASSCGQNSDGSWGCIVYIHSPDTNEGMLHWTTSSSGINGITFRSSSGDMAPGDWNQSVVTIPATSCPASATLYFNPNGSPATVAWSC
jgi:serine/threonine protein kinase